MSDELKKPLDLPTDHAGVTPQRGDGGNVVNGLKQPDRPVTTGDDSFARQQIADAKRRQGRR